MPFKSKSQVRACFAANDPNWDCHEWAHATPSIKKLPDRKPKRKEASDMSVIAMLGRQAAEKPMIEKLAYDSGLTPTQIEIIAQKCEVTPATLVKQAYANPEGFANVVRTLNNLPTKTASELKPVAHAQSVATKKPNPFAKKADKKPVPKMATDLASSVILACKRAIEKKAADNRTKSAMLIMNHFLDKVASKLSAEKQASCRIIQAQLALGKPLVYAVKMAFPQLRTGEQRGIVAQRLVKAAEDDFKGFMKKKQGPKSVSGKPGSPEVGKLFKEGSALGKQLATSGLAAAGGVGGGAAVMGMTDPDKGMGEGLAKGLGTGAGWGAGGVAGAAAGLGAGHLASKATGTRSLASALNRPLEASRNRALKIGIGKNPRAMAIQALLAGGGGLAGGIMGANKAQQAMASPKPAPTPPPAPPTAGPNGATHQAKMPRKPGMG